MLFLSESVRFAVLEVTVFITCHVVVKVLVLEVMQNVRQE